MTPHVDAALSPVLSRLALGLQNPLLSLFFLWGFNSIGCLAYSYTSERRVGADKL